MSTEVAVLAAESADPASRSLSGYDLRTIADEDPNAFKQRRIDPWTNELTLQPEQSLWNYFFRYQLGYYPTRSLLWEADARGHFKYNTLYETGLSYNASAPGTLTWNNRVGFYLSPGWRIDTTLDALMPNQSLNSVKDGTFIQTQFVVTRDMHCWNVQFSYKNLPPFTRKYSFLFNLKLGAQAAKDITDPDLESQFYPWRDPNTN